MRYFTPKNQVKCMSASRYETGRDEKEKMKRTDNFISRCRFFEIVTWSRR